MYIIDGQTNDILHYIENDIGYMNVGLLINQIRKMESMFDY